MCRLGFYVGKKMNISPEVIISTSLWGESNSDGTGILMQKDEESFMIKEAIKASDFWIKHKINLFTNKAIFHVRFATSGTKDIQHTHPFFDLKTGIGVVHNGCLFNWKDAKKKLEALGCVFNSECDSEILLHAYIKFNNNFVSWLKENGVTGSATVLIYTKKGIYCFTNMNSLVVYKTEDGLFGFSDDKISLNKYSFKYKLEDNVLYLAKPNGLFIVKKLPSFGYTFNYKDEVIYKYPEFKSLNDSFTDEEFIRDKQTKFSDLWGDY